ncbi:hypothetical protein [Nitratireductor sp. OM-1]|uniref:hypothetical protein n=1 Tax=Nitratireductor sp. OM-1 TaxID=1756988 RepID=UPI000DDEB0A9|nr:hypothetical protein [Nitratireductor sp. OM-1]
MSSKLKISKTKTPVDDYAEDEVETVVEDPVAEPVAEAPAEPATETPKPEDYGKGGVYRSVGGGKRVRV